MFLMVDSADHISAKTGLTPTVTLSKSGAAFAAPAGAVTEVGSGWYKVAGNATDTGTLGPLVLHATATGADPVDVEFEVVAFDPQDAAGFGLSRLDAAISTRLAPATAGRTLVVDAAGLADANAVKLGPTGAGTAQTARDVGASVLVGDKTGFSLSAGGVQAIWDALMTALTTAGSVGKLLADNLNATISSRLAPTVAGRTLDVSAGGEAGIDWANIGGNTTVVNLSGTTVKHVTDAVDVGSLGSDTVNAAALSTDAVAEIQSGLAVPGSAMTLTSGERTTLAAAIWNALLTGITTVGSIGKLIKDNLDAAISTRSSHSAADVWAVGTRTLTGFGTLVADVATAVWAAGARTLTAFGFSVTAATVQDKTGYSLAVTPPTAAQVRQEMDANSTVLARLLGLSQDNWVMDDTTYDGSCNLTAATLYLYDSAPHATTHDKATGLIGKYTMSGAFTGASLTLAKQVRVS
jgi:hypothetical protein